MPYNSNDIYRYPASSGCLSALDRRATDATPITTRNVVCPARIPGPQSNNTGQIFLSTLLDRTDRGCEAVLDVTGERSNLDLHGYNYVDHSSGKWISNPQNGHQPRPNPNRGRHTHVILPDSYAIDAALVPDLNLVQVPDAGRRLDSYKNTFGANVERWELSIDAIPSVWRDFWTTQGRRILGRFPANQERNSKDMISFCHLEYLTFIYQDGKLDRIGVQIKNLVDNGFPSVQDTSYEIFQFLIPVRAKKDESYEHPYPKQ